MIRWVDRKTYVQLSSAENTLGLLLRQDGKGYRHISIVPCLGVLKLHQSCHSVPRLLFPIEQICYRKVTPHNISFQPEKDGPISEISPEDVGWHMQ